MKKKIIDFEKLWVGMIPSNGEIIIYDPSMQIAESRNTYVYSDQINNMVEKSTDFLTSKVIVLKDSIQEQFVQEYFTWRERNGDIFLEMEKQEIQFIAKEVAREHKRRKKKKHSFSNTIFP